MTYLGNLEPSDKLDCELLVLVEPYTNGPRKMQGCIQDFFWGGELF